jgi:hypothetical protein
MQTTEPFSALLRDFFGIEFPGELSVMLHDLTTLLFSSARGPKHTPLVVGLDRVSDGCLSNSNQANSE